jgi:4-hydroxy-tetrahydrodipicolinate synthase
VDLSLALVQRLAEEEGVIGIKDSSGNLRNYQQLVAAVRSERFGVVTGSDGLLFFELISGGDGCISPGANVAPHWFVALKRAYHEGRWQDAWGIQERIQALHRGIGHGTFPAGIKGALEVMGIAERYMAAPNVPVSNEALATIRATLDQLELL